MKELSHFNKAKQALILATKIDEVKEIRDKAEALRIYSKQAGESLEMQNQCAEIKIRAERRAGELLGEQGRKQGERDETLQDERFKKPKLADMGISEIQSHRWQKEADIGEETLERYLASCKEKETEVTTIGFLKAAGIHTKLKSEGGQEYWTPDIYMCAVLEVLEEIDLDPSSCEEANKTVGAKKFYSKEEDGLIQSWFGKIFMNPPYGEIGPAFIKKFIDEHTNGHIQEGIILVNSGSTDTNWFQPLFDGILCFTNHRILFDSPTKDRPPPAPIHGSCFVYFGPNSNKFASVFSEFGNVVIRYGANK